MKGKLLRPYEIDLSHTICAGEELEIVGEYYTCDGYSYKCIMPDGTQREINADYLGITDNTPYIDWEQRRYEIAKCALQGYLASPIIPGVDPNPSVQKLAEYSVRVADALIEELKKDKQ